MDLLSTILLYVLPRDFIGGSYTGIMCMTVVKICVHSVQLYISKGKHQALLGGYLLRSTLSEFYRFAFNTPTVSLRTTLPSSKAMQVDSIS